MKMKPRDKINDDHAKNIITKAQYDERHAKLRKLETALAYVTKRLHSNYAPMFIPNCTVGMLFHADFDWVRVYITHSTSGLIYQLEVTVDGEATINPL